MTLYCLVIIPFALPVRHRLVVDPNLFADTPFQQRRQAFCLYGLRRWTTRLHQCNGRVCRQRWEAIEETANYLLSRTKQRPRIAIILGTGFGGLADLMHNVDEFPYHCIPHFVQTTGNWSTFLYKLFESNSRFFCFITWTSKQTATRVSACVVRWLKCLYGVYCTVMWFLPRELAMRTAPQCGIAKASCPSVSL